MNTKNKKNILFSIYLTYENRMLSNMIDELTINNKTLN